MEQLQEQNKKIQEYRRKVLEKTCTPRELLTLTFFHLPVRY